MSKFISDAREMPCYLTVMTNTSNIQFFHLSEKKARRENLIRLSWKGYTFPSHVLSPLELML